MSKKILVTGANGFLGSAITKLALKKGFKVNVLVRKSSNTDNLKSISSKINFVPDLAFNRHVKKQATLNLPSIKTLSGINP